MPAPRQVSCMTMSACRQSSATMPSCGSGPAGPDRQCHGIAGDKAEPAIFDANEPVVPSALLPDKLGHRQGVEEFIGDAEDRSAAASRSAGNIMPGDLCCIGDGLTASCASAGLVSSMRTDAPARSASAGPRHAACRASVCRALGQARSPQHRPALPTARTYAPDTGRTSRRTIRKFPAR